MTTSCGVRAVKVETPGDMRSFDLRFSTAIFGLRMPPKTACRARGGVLYTQLAKFAALAVQGGVEPQTENCERRTAKTLITGRYRSGQTGQTVNLLAHAFAGSNPALPNPLSIKQLGRTQ